MADATVELEIIGDTSDFDKKVASLNGNVQKAIGGGMASASKALDGASTSIASKLGSTLSKPFSAIGEKVGQIIPGFKDGFAKAGEIAGNALKAIGDTAGKAFSKIGELAMGAGKVIAAGIGAGLALIGKQAFEAYGEFEQLEGGVKLALGDEVWKTVESRSKDAFKNMQMSQNDYLSQVNLMATGLRESLGGNEQAAADLADRVIRSQADIVSAMGITQESAQNAFNGIMRGNFTMLDSLGIGVKGTKEGMQEVIDKVNEWNATQSDRTATDYTIDNLADCQAALADYVEYLGLSGYAASEGADTIQGSISKMKAAWSDWTAELAKPDADMSRVSENLATSIQDAAGNIIPAFARAVGAAMGELPGILSTLAPTIALGIAQAVATAMGMDVHEEESAGELAMRIVNVICNHLVIGAPSILASASEMLAGIGTAATELAPTVIDTVLLLIENLITNFADNLPGMLDGAGQFFGSILTAIGNRAPGILSAIVQLLLSLIKSLPERIPAMLSAALSFIGTVLTAIVQQVPTILSALGELVGNLIGSVRDGVGNMLSAGLEFIGGMLSGVKEKAGEIMDWFRGLPGRIIDALGNIGSRFLPVGSNIIGGIKDGILNAAGSLASSVINAASNALGGVKSFLGIASPSKVFRDRIGRWITLGVAEGVEDEQGALDRAMAETFSADGVLDALDAKVSEWSFSGLLAAPEVAMAAPVPAYALNGLSRTATLAASGPAGLASEAAFGTDLASKLDKILSAIEAGKVIQIDSRVLGRTVRKAL